jgi:protein TonB
VEAGPSTSIPKAEPDPSFALTITVTSLVLHFLVVGTLGFGLPKIQSARTKSVATPPASEVKLIEDVQLETPQAEAKPPEPDSTELPPPSADVDLPPLAKIEPISAVPVSVPVAFGITVKGPLKLVSDPAQATGAIGGRVLPAPTPISLDGAAGRSGDLLLPALAYPPESIQRREVGTVIVAFRTTAEGDVYDGTVTLSSGFPRLDRAALQNLRSGRFAGPAGYYQKRFEFRLK